MTIKCPFFEEPIVMEEVAVAVAVVVVVETGVDDAARRGTRLTWLTAHNHIVVVGGGGVVVVGGGVVGIVVGGIGIDRSVVVGVGGRDSGGRNGSRGGGSDRRKSQKRSLS